jgi:anaerobic selenocysteine-containing dehydrogenase
LRTSFCQRPLSWRRIAFQGLTNNRTIIFAEADRNRECRDEFDVAGDILKRCGLGDRWPWKNVEEFYEEEMRKKGLSWYEFKDDGWYEGKVDYKKYETDYYRKGGGFATPTGKIEVFSTKWRELGYDPLPFYQEQAETPYSRPDLAREYPYVLITGGRTPFFFHSDHRQVKRLRRIHPDPIVQIHPETAQTLGLVNGDWAWIETPRGRCKQKVQLYDGMDRRIIHIEHDWWFPEKPQGEPDFSGAFESNANMLTSCEERFIDPGHGGYNLRALLCKVYKV